MPNKYSHALVLSHYDRRGLIDFDQPHFSDFPPFKPARSKSRPRTPVIQPSRPCHASSKPNATGRLRIASRSPPPFKSSPPPLHRRGSSVETQIYAPARSPSPIARHELPGSDVETPDYFAQPQIPSPPSTSFAGPHYAPAQTPPRTSTAHDDNQSTTADDIFDLYSSPSPTTKTDWSNSSAVKALRRASWASRPLSSNGPRPGSSAGMSRSLDGMAPVREHLISSAPSKPKNPWVDAHMFPKRPPSPPATPEEDHSFMISTEREGSDFVNPTPRPPLPDRSPRRTPRRVSFSQDPAELPALEIPPKATGAKVSSPVPSPTFSMTTRKSSLDASGTPPTFQTPYQSQPGPSRPRARSAVHSSSLSMTSRKSSIDASALSSYGWAQLQYQGRRPSTAVHSPKPLINERTSSLNTTATHPTFSRVSSMPSELFVDDDDADLESLPSPMDFDVTPWADRDAGPIVFRNNPPLRRPLSIMSTSASSFDSAAPPPIRLRGSIDPTPIEKPLPKGPKKRFASMLFSRLGPKALLYSQTISGEPPIPISVSRNAAPSISALFPNYRGQFPPPPPPPQSEREAIFSNVRTRNSSTSTPTRDRSVPSRNSGEKRKSWFKSNQMDRVLGRGQSVIEKNIQEIISANQSVISGEYRG